MEKFEELVEKVISDEEFRKEFFQDPEKILDKYKIEISKEELEKLKSIGDAKSDELSKELSERISKSCSWQT